MSNGRRRIPELWPLGLTAMLAAMMGTGTAFYRIAERNPDAVIGDAQQASLHYSETVRAARRVRELGGQLELNTELRADGAHATATLRDATGASLEAERVTLRRERPAEGGYDAEFALARAGASWAGQIELPRRGRWQLVARAERDGERIERRVALWLP